jgi:ankyrin repeat protein
LHAASRWELAAIKRLYAEGVDVTERGEQGFTAIMLAAMNGHIATVKFLQAAGATINERNENGFSALLLAAAHGRFPLVEYFLQEAGASISDATSRGRTVWILLDLQDDDTIALASLLKIMVMLDDAPLAFVAKLSPANAELTTADSLP